MCKKSAFIDNDIIVKIGQYSDGVYLRDILVSLDCKMYIYEYIYNVELKLWHKQYSIIENMVDKKEIEIIYKTSLSVTQRCAYDSAFNLLAIELELNDAKKM